jgi:hypothetical protein
LAAVIVRRDFPLDSHHHTLLLGKWTVGFMAVEGSDRITLQLNREDAAALVHVLDRLLQLDWGNRTGSLLRAFRIELLDQAFGGSKPSPPEGWPEATEPPRRSQP